MAARVVGMSSGASHYLEAERLLQLLDELPDREVEALGRGDSDALGFANLVLAQAQVHATLALAAATATQLTGQFIELDDDAFAWNEAAGTPPRGVEDVHLP